MFRRMLVCVISVSTVWGFNPAYLSADEVREVNIIASAHDSPLEAGIGPIQLRERGGLVIRNANELVALSAKPNTKDATERKELEAELAKVLDMSTVDWSKQMVLAVRGTQGTRLDRIHIDSLKAEGKVLTVTWKIKQRPPHAGPGSPVSLLLVERFDEVKFVEAGQ